VFVEWLFTNSRRNVAGKDLFTLSNGYLRSQLEVEIWKLDVIRVVQASVVDQAVDGVQNNSRKALITPMNDRFCMPIRCHFMHLTEGLDSCRWF